MKRILSLFVFGFILVFAIPSAQAARTIQLSCFAWIGSSEAYFSDIFEFTESEKPNVHAHRFVSAAWDQYLKERLHLSTERWVGSCGGSKAENVAHARDAKRKIIETGWTYNGAPAVGR